MVDEMERSVHDTLCVVKRVLESKSVVPGGGCVEAALSIYLENLATSLVSYKHKCTCLYYVFFVSLTSVWFKMIMYMNTQVYVVKRVKHT